MRRNHTPDHPVHVGISRPVARLARTWPVFVLGCAVLAACQPSKITPAKSHLLRPTDPPVIVRGGPDIAPKQAGPGGAPAGMAGPDEEVYTITVTEMPVRDLLFALAQDANKNIDVYPGITGRVTLSAIDQTLPQILNRVANQVGIRYEIDDANIIVSPDRPYLKVYRIDYVNVSRKSMSSNKISSQLTTQFRQTDLVTDNSTANQSQSVLSNQVVNEFWKNLEVNIEAILDVNVTKDDNVIKAALELDDPLLAGEGRAIGAALPPAFATTRQQAAAQPDFTSIVTMNPEAGVVTIIATARQHERIQEYLDTVMDSVHRQVLIESTVVEVELSDAFQKGVDWGQLYSRALGIAASGIMTPTGFIDNLANANVLTQSVTDSNTGITTRGNFVGGSGTSFTIPQQLASNFSLTAGTAGKNGAVLATIKALEAFGSTKVLSSPKIMALNNQPAVLKVVRNQVFFTLKSGSATNSVPSGLETDAVVATQPIFDTQIHTVPEGLVMTVTPQISEEGIVSMSVRPTISRISEWVNDPNPALAPLNLQTGIRSQIVNRIPVMEIKEMETMMRVHSGQVAVMGGLMQDAINKVENNVPMLSRLPGLGHLFQNESRGTQKTELVVFLRPVVISHGQPRLGEMTVSNLSVATGSQERAAEVRNRRNAGSRGTASRRPAGLDAGEENQPEADAPPTQGPVPDQPPTAPEPAPGAASPGAYLDFTRPGGGRDLSLRETPAATQTSLVAPTPAVPALPPEPAPFRPSRPVVAPPAPQAALVPVPGGVAGRSRGYFIDLGSYQMASHAEEVHAQVRAIGLPTYGETATVSGKSFQRVRSGPFTTRDDAVAALDSIAGSTGIHHASISAF